MITIDFASTFKNITRFVTEYNQQFFDAVPSNYGKNKNPDPDSEPDRNRKDTAKMLRSNHEMLMQRLVKNFAAQLNEAQSIHGEFQYLPLMRTNNGVLAKQLGVTKTTIWNLMTRLGPDGAKFILGKRFRGSTHDYEIKLNVALFSIAKKGLPAIPVGNDDEVLDQEEYLTTVLGKPTGSETGSGSQAKSRQNFTGEILPEKNSKQLKTKTVTENFTGNSGHFTGEIQATTAPFTGNSLSAEPNAENPVNNPQKNEVFNTYSEKQNNDFTEIPKKDIKKFNDKEECDSLKKNSNISGEIVRKMTISELFFLFKGDTPNQKSSSINENSKGSAELLPDLEKKETPPVAAPPSSTQNGPQRHQKYVVILHNLMYGTIFSRQRYHAPTQVDAAKQYLIQAFTGLDDSQAKAKFSELKIRIILAFEWLKKGDIRKKDGSIEWTRYIPIPSVYLDPLNFDCGFVNTLVWHDKFVENRRNRKKLTEVNDQVAEYFERWDLLNRALDFYLKDANHAAYKKAKNYLKKKNPEIIYAFDTMVLRNQHKISA